jgi:hypothetical protein
LAEKAFQDQNKVVWIRLTDFNYTITALYLPTLYRKEATCEAHDSALGCSWGSQCYSKVVP